MCEICVCLLRLNPFPSRHPELQGERALDRMARHMQRKARKVDAMLQNIRSQLGVNRKKLTRLLEKSQANAEERVRL